MTYFLIEDFSNLSNPSPDIIAQLSEKLVSLHRDLFPQLRNYHLDLHLCVPNNRQIVTDISVASLKRDESVLCLHYGRANNQAVLVERRMGRDDVTAERIEPQRHPIVEVRLTPKNLVLELIVTPEARLDQQNFSGKLTIERHRRAIYEAIQTLKGEYYLGFWRGLDLHEMHLHAKQFRWTQLLNEWLSTFSAGSDWFRVGVWYMPDAPQLVSGALIEELTDQIRALYRLYAHILWTSDNNFVQFYKHTTRSTPYR